MNADAPRMNNHIPNNVEGINRCSKCGLAEIYWERFPQCDFAKDISPAPLKKKFTVDFCEVIAILFIIYILAYSYFTQ